jgi:tetratricopeptide (TPR) repeat protein
LVVVTGRLLVVVTCLSLFAAGPSAAAGPGASLSNRSDQQNARLQSYLECVNLLRAGQPDNAVVTLLGHGDGWLTATLPEVLPAVRARDWRLGERDIEAAILLHLGAFRYPGVLPSVMRNQLDAAWNLAAAAGERIPRDFLRDCRLVVIWSLQRDRDIENVIVQLGEALGDFPDDAELLVSLGSAWEWMATEPDAGTMRFRENRATGAIAIRPPRGTQSDGVLLNLAAPLIYERCASLYEKALRRSPAPDEARLRLGRVLLLIGRPNEALRALGPLRTGAAADRPREFRYLLALVQGRAWLAAGQAGAAVGAYREALALYPGCQTSQVALSAALRAAGDQAGARSVMAAMLAPNQQFGCVKNPWLDYLVGQPWRLEALVSRLASEVRR